MSIKVVTISYDKGGTLERQSAELEKAKASLEVLLQSANKVISVIEKEELGQFVAIVDLPEKRREEDKPSETVEEGK